MAIIPDKIGHETKPVGIWAKLSLVFFDEEESDRLSGRVLATIPTHRFELGSDTTRLIEGYAANRVVTVKTRTLKPGATR
jgi:hypothetical protein